MVFDFSFLKNIFGDQNEKWLKKLDPIVEEVNSLEPEFENLTDQELKAKTPEFKERLQNGETLEDILPEAFATVREASKRTLGMRHYDVQIIGAIAIHRGNISEMRTGEGKTLVATMPAYLNALEEKGVHVVTVNDYLAKRDAVWMGQIYDFLGLSVSAIGSQRSSYKYDGSAGEEGSDLDQQRDETGEFNVVDEFLEPIDRAEAYQADITYGTNNEFGFDYLRDNMVQEFDEMVMRRGNEMHFAILDEIDSILIDEARTPLIISSPAEEATDLYYKFADLVVRLDEDEDYNVDEKMESVSLTQSGIEKMEEWLGIDNLYTESGITSVHHIEQALKAELLFEKDKDYIVEDGEVVIIDEFTGRKMPGRRFSGGLHQALEAKEGVEIQRESKTLAKVTFQNFFRMYDKLSGMTGTAKTEEEEFFKIYGLKVLVVPTNEPDIREDHPDQIYKTERGKFKAILRKLKDCRERGQPVLVGTRSVEKNEQLSTYLNQHGIDHEKLNAKNHEREGEIIAQAGRPGAITLATNMAGRGVDIKLGGNPPDPKEREQVMEAGGLFVLGTERHESRRIDNQLRGRCARQGEPGETQFFVSCQDELMRIFAGDRMEGVLEGLNVPEDQPIQQNMITKMLEKAQEKVEGRNFDMRKQVLKYDEVLNKQRKAMYNKRRKILKLAEDEEIEYEEQEDENDEVTSSVVTDEFGNEIAVSTDFNYESLKEFILHMMESEIRLVVYFHTNPDENEELEEQEKSWNIEEIVETAKTIMPINSDLEEELLSKGKKEGDERINEDQEREEIINLLIDRVHETYDQMEEGIAETVEDTNEDSREIMRDIEKTILLQAMDELWVEHLVNMRELRNAIGLRSYAQKDPLIEYKRETFQMFNQLQSNIQKEVVYKFFKIDTGLQLGPSIMAQDDVVLESAKDEDDDSIEATDAFENDQVTTTAAGQLKYKDGSKVGRNDPCPCGSGKKYKKCCLQ
ncbi:MAG: preprotein translocase subunit SecA [Candidatus Magasanikbacteria bacterium]